MFLVIQERYDDDLYGFVALIRWLNFEPNSLLARFF